MIQEEFKWLLDRKENSCILNNALEWIDIAEFPGEESNPFIIEWVGEIGALGRLEDSHAWCASFLSAMVQRCGYELPLRAFKSRGWLEWGQTVEVPEVGDIVIYKRPGGRGHIGLFIQEEGEFYWTLGGNQRMDSKDSVNIKRLRKRKCLRICRPTENEKKNQDQINS